MIKARIDASKLMADYSQALRRLAQLSGFDQKQVLLAEAGAILKTWAGRTKVVKQADADKRSWISVLGKRGLDLGSAREPGDISVNMGVRGNFGRVWVRTDRGKFKLAGQIDPRSYDFRPMQHHWKRKTWIDIKEVAADVAFQARKKLPKGRQAAGLARQSVVQIADALNIDLLAVKGGGISAAGIAKARAAIATTGRAHRNGAGTVTGQEIQTTVRLINSLPYASAPKVAMDTTLRGIIAGRVKFFYTSYAKGAFDTMTKTARAYPWLRVSAAGLS